jgi:hypothetical protein
MTIYDETQRPPTRLGKKKPIIRIRSPFLPFPSGTCKMCGQKHSPVFIRLEHGGSIIVPESAVPKEERDQKQKDKNKTKQSGRSILVY